MPPSCLFRRLDCNFLTRPFVSTAARVPHHCGAVAVVILLCQFSTCLQEPPELNHVVPYLFLLQHFLWTCFFYFNCNYNAPTHPTCLYHLENMSISTVQNVARFLALGYMGTGIASIAVSVGHVFDGECIEKGKAAPVSPKRKNAPTHPTVFYLGQCSSCFGCVWRLPPHLAPSCWLFLCSPTLAPTPLYLSELLPHSLACGWRLPVLRWLFIPWLTCTKFRKCQKGLPPLCKKVVNSQTTHLCLFSVVSGGFGSLWETYISFFIPPKLHLITVPRQIPAALSRMPTPRLVQP